MIKPFKIVVYFFIVIALLGMISWLFPIEGIRVSDDVTLKWPTLNDYFSLKEDEFTIADSTMSIAQPAVAAKNILGFRNELLKLDSLTLKQLVHFFSELSHLKDSTRVIRILHIGDSQIEGDRISRFLRVKLQERFGGGGPGLVPVYESYKQFPSIWITNSGQWLDNKVYESPRMIQHYRYGLSGRVHRLVSENGSVKLSGSPLGEKRSRLFNRIQLMVETGRSELEATLTTPLLDTVFAIPSQKNAESFDFVADSLFSMVDFHFSTRDTVSFLGCYLDVAPGVALDNIALRGQIDPRLHRTDTILIRQMAEKLDVGLVLLQFGTNMLPTVSREYSFYRKKLVSQISILKRIMPNTPIILIGAGAAASSVNGKITAMMHAQLISDAQKQAAEYGHIGYFDLLQCMGGVEAMIKWHDEQPVKSMSDYMHLNRLGGSIVADSIYNSLMTVYNRWTATLP